MAWAGVCSVAVFSLLLVHCLMILPLVCGVSVFRLVLFCYALLSDLLWEEGRVGCFTLIVFLMSCVC